MSAFLQVVSKRRGAVPLVLVDGPPFTPWILVGKDFGPGASWQHAFAAARGTQGRRPSSGTPDDRQVIFTLLADDYATKDALAADLSTLQRVIDEMRRFGGYVTFREHEQTDTNTAEVLVAGAAIADWSGQEFDSRNCVRPALSFTCAPYLLGAPCDISEDFATDNVTAGDLNYTFDAGSILTDLAVTGGQLKGAGTLTTERRIIFTGRGYTHGDQEATAYFAPGATITSFRCGVVLKRVDALNYLVVYIDDNGTNSRLRIDKVVAGTPTNLASTNLGARLINGRTAWCRGRIEGGVVFAEHFIDTNVPTPTVAPTTSTSYAFTTAEAALFGAGIEGKGGLTFTPQASGAYVEAWEFLPWTYRNPPTYVLECFGDIPGDAPALADVRMAAGSAGNPATWAMFAWEARAAVRNLCIWGDFERNATTGWTAAGVSGVTGAASSITAVIDGTLGVGAKYGEYVGQIVTPATANTGAAYPMYERFRAGVTYTATGWVRSAAGTTNVRLRLGVSGDVASSTAVALSPTWTQHTVTWTPTASVDVAYVAFEVTAATATTFQIDGVCPYQGTTAPTIVGQLAGQGAAPMLAVMRAEQSLVTVSLNLTRTSDATANGGFSMADSSVAGGGEEYTGGWPVEPALSDPDDYAQGSVRVEVWARVLVSAAFTGGVNLLCWATAESGTAQVWTPEFTTVGSPVSIPSSGNSKWRLTRLGTLDLRTDRETTGRWTINVSARVAAGTNTQAFAIDDFFVIPERSRFLLPTGKDRSGALAGTYPVFFSDATAYRVVRSDLTSIIAKTANAGPAGGINGSLVELPTGPINVLGLLSGLEPDEPVAVSTSEDQGFSSLHLSVKPRYNWLAS